MGFLAKSGFRRPGGRFTASQGGRLVNGLSAWCYATGGSLVAMCVLGCGVSDPNTPPPPAVAVVTVTPDEALLASLGETVQLVASLVVKGKPPGKTLGRKSTLNMTPKRSENVLLFAFWKNDFRILRKMSIFTIQAATKPS